MPEKIERKMVQFTFDCQVKSTKKIAKVDVNVILVVMTVASIAAIMYAAFLNALIFQAFYIRIS